MSDVCRAALRAAGASISLQTTPGCSDCGLGLHCGRDQSLMSLIHQRWVTGAGCFPHTQRPDPSHPNVPFPGLFGKEVGWKYIWLQPRTEACGSCRVRVSSLSPRESMVFWVLLLSAEQILCAPVEGGTKVGQEPMGTRRPEGTVLAGPASSSPLSMKSDIPSLCQI